MFKLRGNMAGGYIGLREGKSFEACGLACRAFRHGGHCRTFSKMGAYDIRKRYSSAGRGNGGKAESEMVPYSSGEIYRRLFLYVWRIGAWERGPLYSVGSHDGKRDFADPRQRKNRRKVSADLRSQRGNGGGIPGSSCGRYVCYGGDT